MRRASIATTVLFLGAALAQVDQRRTNNGDNGPAIRAEINDPFAIAIDGGKVLYIAQNQGGIRRIDLKTGIIRTLRTKTRLEAIDSLVVDNTGNLIANEYTMDRIRRIDPVTGAVTTLAANLSRPEFVTTDAGGNIYIADWGRIRRVDANTGIITTVAGNGKGSNGDDGPATDAGLGYGNSVAVDRDGNLFISQQGSGQYSDRIRQSDRIRRVDARTGVITTIAGLTKAGLTGDGGPAISAALKSPSSLLFDPKGNLYFIDRVNDRIRYIDSKTQLISNVAGSTKGFAGDGGPAVQARLNNPCSIAMDSEENLYIADFGNHRIRRVDMRSGIIQTIAGNGGPNHLHELM